MAVIPMTDAGERAEKRAAAVLCVSAAFAACHDELRGGTVVADTHLLQRAWKKLLAQVRDIFVHWREQRRVELRMHREV